MESIDLIEDTGDRVRLPAHAYRMMSPDYDENVILAVLNKADTNADERTDLRYWNPSLNFSVFLFVERTSQLIRMTCLYSAFNFYFVLSAL